MDQLTIATATFRTVRDRIREQDPQIDEQTLADMVEGLTDLHEILTAVIRAALADQALATGLEGRIGEMLQKALGARLYPSIRPGTPTLMVIDEAAVPSIYWEPREPRLNRQGLANDLKQGAEIAGVALSNPEPVLSVRTK